MSRYFPILTAFALLSIASTGFAADNGDVVIVEGNCPDGQHADLAGGCVCTDPLAIMVDSECVLDPGRLFGDLDNLLLDACQAFDFCGGAGGGGGGNPGPPDPGPEDEDVECADPDGPCAGEYAQCATEALQDAESCKVGEAMAFCFGAPGSMWFPDGSTPECQIVPKTGRVVCLFVGGSDPFPKPPYVGEPSGLLDRCISDWLVSDALTDEIVDCQNASVDQLGQCQDRVSNDCGCTQPLPTTLAGAAAEADQEPELGLFLRAKVRTKGETAIDVESFARNGTKSVCYWHLTSAGSLPPKATLYCRAGDIWDEVGASRFLMADGDQYLADGACGIATQDGVASGNAAFRWKLERDDDGLLVGAKMKSVAGHIVGSLDGAHPYYGDCKVTGKAIEERQVPSGLLELVRER